jgi:DNA replication protein DnaC
MAGKGEPTPRKFRRHISQLMLRVTLIDELGYLTIKPEQTNAFFRLMDQRYSRVSTIITTNLDLPDWYSLFDKKPLVDALLDRLQHHCITIRIDGPSLRRPDPPTTPPANPTRRNSKA